MDARGEGEQDAVFRVTSCALGLAVEGREDAEGLRALLAAADGDEALLQAARARITDLETLESTTRVRADALLYIAISHGDRLTLGH